MRSISIVFALAVILGPLTCCELLAQGCNLGINSLVPECRDSHGNIVEYGAVCCYGYQCAPPGQNCQYCYMGYGACPPGSTGQFTTANWGYQDSCCGSCMPPPQGCSTGYVWVPYPTCECQGQASPIIVDTRGTGFRLTSANNGVAFDIRGNGNPIRISWTAADSGNAFLALDRDHNGSIDNGKELFGNFTEQPASADPNGFLALAEFDKPENGGNGDAIIDKRDAIFAELSLWVDDNHDGVSQPNELHRLNDLGVFSLGLRYRQSRRVDQFGNVFRYKAAVNPDPFDGDSQDGRVTYDVFFGTLQDKQPKISTGLEAGSVSGGYRNGMLLDDIELATRRDWTRCRSFSEEHVAGGTR